MVGGLSNCHPYANSDPTSNVDAYSYSDGAANGNAYSATNISFHALP